MTRTIPRATRLAAVLVLSFLGLTACGGSEDAPEPPGLSGISFHLKADAAQNLHVVYRAYAEGDGRQPEDWTRVYYRRFDAATSAWTQPFQVNDEKQTPSDTSTRFNQPRISPLPGSSRVAVAWSLDFRSTRGVLVGVLETAGAAPQLLASTDVFGGQADWEFKQFGLEGLSASEMSLFWTLITPRDNDVWETPLSFDGAIRSGARRFVGTPTGQHIASAVDADGTLWLASTFGTNRNNLLLASRRSGANEWQSSRLDVEGAVGVTALLPRTDRSGLDLFFLTAFHDDSRKLGRFLLRGVGRLAPVESGTLDQFGMRPDRVELVQAAQSAGGRQAVAWGRGVERQSIVVVREPGQGWPTASELAQRAIIIGESDAPGLAFVGERLHVVYRDLAKNGTSHRSYGPEGERVEAWDFALE